MEKTLLNVCVDNLIEGKRFTPLSTRLGFLPSDCYRLPYIELNDGLIIRNKRRFLKKSIQMDNVIAYDTETYQGFCRLLADSLGNYILTPTFTECLDFLFRNAKYKRTYHMWFNIDFDISAIFKLARSEFSSLKEYNIFMRIVLDGTEIEYKGYKIKWIKEKLFILKKDKKVIRFTDLNSFFQMSLDKTFKKYIDNRRGKDPIKADLLNTSLKYWSNNLNKIIQYCIKDCILTAKLGIELVNRIKKVDIELPRMLVSNASLAKQHFRIRCYIPSIHHIPRVVLNASYESYAGGRFEIFKRGYFDEAILVDIVSEYPDMIRKLPSFKYGRWYRVNEIADKETIGFYKVRVFIPPDVRVSPMVYKKKEINLWITGYQEGFFTWYDVDLMREYILEVVIGYEYVPSKNEYYPFKNEIERLAKLKTELKKSKDTMLVLPVKYCMNGFYGANYERHKVKRKDGSIVIEGGVLFNPVNASIITAYGRWRLMKDIKKDDYKYILAFHTDSIILEKKLDYLDYGINLGQWTIENKDGQNQSIIINTGVYMIGKSKCASRGIPKKYINKNWWTFAHSHKFDDKVEFQHKKMIKIREALKQDKNLARLNVMDDIKKTIDINSDKKRTWFDDFYNFEDLLSRNIDSLPHFNHIDGDGNETLIKNPLLSKDFNSKMVKV